MIIKTDTFIPYEFDKYNCLKYIVCRTQNLKKSLRKVYKKTGYLLIRCPVSGDYLEIIGKANEIEWIDKQLIIGQWYRTT